MNKFCFFITLLSILLFSCNTTYKTQDFIGTWVVNGDTYERKICIGITSSSIDGKEIYWDIKNDGFFFYDGETLKIISISKDTLRFMKLKGTPNRPVGTEEVWIRVP